MLEESNSSYFLTVGSISNVVKRDMSVDVAACKLSRLRISAYLGDSRRLKVCIPDLPPAAVHTPIRAAR